MNKAIFSLVPADGRELWRHDFRSGYETHAADPGLIRKNAAPKNVMPTQDAVKNSSAPERIGVIGCGLGGLAAAWKITSTWCRSIRSDATSSTSPSAV